MSCHPLIPCLILSLHPLSVFRSHSRILLMCSNTLATLLNDSQVSCSLSVLHEASLLDVKVSWPFLSSPRPRSMTYWDSLSSSQSFLSSMVRYQHHELSLPSPSRASLHWWQRPMIWTHSSCCRPATKRGLRVSSEEPVMERGRVCAYASPTLSSRVVISRCRRRLLLLLLLLL
ncbi:hypothetical protein F5148DRAFT_472607 [Russula earlei]|uniref:Uncharacterized protein n=1 Tax=Russula earlei TaxID=71964 RepID=A0ACC0UGW7_9AGAM|nr:hypothetical protein F5148DRAFT_472607 [Russula earlei]